MNPLSRQHRAHLLLFLAAGLASCLPIGAPAQEALKQAWPRVRPADQAQPEPTIAQILNWLPADTETVVQTKGPYRMRPLDDDASVDQALDKQLEKLSYLPLAKVRAGKYIGKLASQEVMLAVEAARRFRAPNGIGLFPYEGCHILVFRRDLGAAGVAFRKALAGGAKEIRKVGEGEVFYFEEKPEQELWKFYIIQPKPNILLCATDGRFLQEVLRRMHKSETPRALPENLPLWKHVPKDARFWAVRQYARPKNGLLVDPDSHELLVDSDSPFLLDPRAIGCIFSFDPSKMPGTQKAPKLTYVSANKNARQLVKKIWALDAAPRQWRVQETGTGVVDVTPVLGNVEQVSQFFLVLLWHLGHGCVI